MVVGRVQSFLLTTEPVGTTGVTDEAKPDTNKDIS